MSTWFSRIIYAFLVSMISPFFGLVAKKSYVCGSLKSIEHLSSLSFA